jgi:hypothetical protein
MLGHDKHVPDIPKPTDSRLDDSGVRRYLQLASGRANHIIAYLSDEGLQMQVGTAFIQKALH